MGKLGVFALVAIAGCGGGAATTSGDPPSDPIEAAAPERDADAVVDRDVKPGSVSDAASGSLGEAADDDGPWLPLVRPDGAAMAQKAQMACVSVFTSLQSHCGARSPLSKAPMGYVDLCAYAHQDAPAYCEGAADTTPATGCVSACWQGRSTTTLADALCVFRCYDAAICGTGSSEALAKCDASSSDPIGCLISGSCYPSFDPTPW